MATQSKIDNIHLVFNTLYQLIRTARPRQWLKNFSLFAAPIFSSLLFLGDTMELALRAFFAFCALSSSVYFLNDIVDADKDRKHPIKKNRPIASGKLSPKLAALVALILMVGSIYYGFTNVGRYFGGAMVLYLVMQFMYTFFIKKVIILDSLFLAAGFVIRVFAGGLASNTSLSSWLALTVIGLSLLMAFGKRRSERTLMSKYDTKILTRKNLEKYPDKLLDSMISMAATYTIITYSMFSFQTSPQNVSTSLYQFLPSVLKSPKWMMFTIPFVIYGVARYLYIIYETEDGESPERVLISDKPLLITVASWGAVILSVIYLIPLMG